MPVVWLSLLHYFTTFSGFLAYFYIFKNRIRISKFDFIFLSGIAFLFVIQFFIKDVLSAVIDFRFYWGWIIFYFIFKSEIPKHKVFNSVLIILSIMVLLEAVLINTVISAERLPNFPSDRVINPNDIVPFGSQYQRPYSFGANASVGSSLLVVLMALCDVRGWRFWLSALSVLVFASGTGIFALAIFLLVRHLKMTVLVASCVAIILSFSGSGVHEEVRHLFNPIMLKIDPDYLNFLLQFKESQISAIFQNTNILNVLFGATSGGRGGDFGMATFASLNGLFGLILLFSMVLYRANRSNKLPLFIIVATSFHYSVMFFLPGQMIFGLLLALGKDGLPEEPVQVIENAEYIKV